MEPCECIFAISYLFGLEEEETQILRCTVETRYRAWVLPAAVWLAGAFLEAGAEPDSAY